MEQSLGNLNKKIAIQSEVGNDICVILVLDKVCTVLATEGGEGNVFWRHKLEANIDIWRYKILLHSTTAGIGKPDREYQISSTPCSPWGEIHLLTNKGSKLVVVNCPGFDDSAWDIVEMKLLDIYGMYLGTHTQSDRSFWTVVK